MEEEGWVKSLTFEDHSYKLLMLEVSPRTEEWCCATFLSGFKIWSIKEDKQQTFILPNGVRNITKK